MMRNSRWLLRSLVSQRGMLNASFTAAFNVLGTPLLANLIFLEETPVFLLIYDKFSHQRQSQSPHWFWNAPYFLRSQGWQLWERLLTGVQRSACCVSTENLTVPDRLKVFSHRGRTIVQISKWQHEHRLQHNFPKHLRAYLFWTPVWQWSRYAPELISDLTWMFRLCLISSGFTVLYDSCFLRWTGLLYGCRQTQIRCH